MKRMCWAVMFLMFFLLSLHLGSTPISWKNVLAGTGEDAFILWNARLPRTISVILAGAGLSLSGMVMQSITQNRFAAPDTIGSTESAKLGMLAGAVFFPELPVSARMLLSFLFAAAGSLLFLTVSSSLSMKRQELIPLMGLMYGSILGGIGNFIAYRYNLLQNLQSWMQGNFSLVIEGQYEGIYFTSFLILALYLFADYFTISRFGKEAAHSLGLSFQAVLTAATILVSFTVVVILIVAGTFPFLGVIIPNLVSLKYDDNIRNTHQKTAFFGGFFLLVCDLFSRWVIRPYEVPVSLVSGIIGGIIFLGLLMKKEQT